jgi:hypothetical protein
LATVIRGDKERVDESDDPGRPKKAEPEDIPLEEDLTGAGLLPPGILQVDVAEIDPEAGTPPSLDIAGVDDRSGNLTRSRPEASDSFSRNLRDCAALT